MDESKSFYEILGIPKDAKKNQIRKAYYKLAVKLHPDRNENKEQATADFQKLALIKETLFDERKRRYYDQTGEVDQDSGDLDTSYEYWRARYKKVTVRDIEKFKSKYKGSGEERQDLTDAYIKYKGDMHKIMEDVPLGSASDINRFVQILDAERNNGNLKKFRAYKTSLKSLSREEDTSEAKESEEYAKELGIDLGGGGEDPLAALIRKRHASRQAGGGFLANLEAKYASKSATKKNKAKKRTKRKDLPSEKEFQKAQKKILKNKN
ncbi:hypothetical protein AAMO2058_000539100 [Amorphochlora amoebiformis]